MTGAPAFKSLLDVSEDAFVRRDVFLRERNKAGIADDVDISFGGIECDQLGALVGACGGGINARSVTPNFVQ